MHYRVIFFGLLFFLIAGSSYSQYVIKGVVYDKAKNTVLPNVIVTCNGGKNQTITDSSGSFNIRIVDPGESVRFSKLGYETYFFSKENKSKDTLITKIFLNEKTIPLNEIEVYGEKVKPVVKNKSFYILDYYPRSNHSFILITYYSNRKGFDVVLSNANNKIVCKKSVSGEEPLKIFRDCLGNINIVSDKYVRQIMNNSDSTFYFLDPVRKGRFDSIVTPCVTKIENELFFYTLNEEGLIQGSFYGFDVKINSNLIFYYKIKNRKIQAVRFITYNKELQEMMNDELKNEMDRWSTGIDVFYHSVQEMENERSNAYSVVFKKIYAPMFSKNDTVVIFNFQAMQIELYNKFGAFLNKINLDEKGFNELHDFEVIQDRATSRFYISYKSGHKKYISEINIYTGVSKKQIKLEKALARNIKIYNNTIYYLVSEKEWDDTSYLYSQDM